MQINLKTAAKEGQFQLSLSSRLPDYIVGPCELLCEYQIQEVMDYYLLTYTVRTPEANPLSIDCQRCLQPFSCPYTNTVTLAVCKSEEHAVKLMDEYECFVSLDNQVDFRELLTDDLYLYVPVNHPDLGNCDQEVSQYIR